MKKALLFVLAASGAAFATAPVITPSIPTVYVSSNVVINADQSVTFSLAPGSTGTLSGATSTSVTFSAPGPIRPKQNSYGCSNSPQDMVWNTKVSALNVNASTTTYLHAQISAAVLTPESDMPTNIYSNSTSSQSLIFNYTPSANGNFKMASAYDLRVENGLFTDKDQVDQHILGVDTNTCITSALYKLYPVGTQSDCLTCNSQSGEKNTDSYTYGLGVSAGGLPVNPLIVKYREFRDCVDKGIPIQHGIRVTFSVGLLANSHIWPATAHAADGGAIPFGAVFRLKSTFTPSGSVAAQCIEQAGKDYGFYVDDGGINGHFQIEQSCTADYDLFTALNELTGISGFNTDNLEAVDMSVLRDADANSPTFNTGRVTSTNTFVVPSNYAVVIASNTSTHQSSFMPIIVQPVTIDVDREVGYSFMAGTPQTRLGVIVHGAVDTSFSCSMTPTLGSLTSDGLYTPPSSTVNRSSSTVTCTATADATASVNFPVIIYSSSSIRVRLANASNVDYGPDTNGNNWFVEKGSFWRLQGHANCDWSSETWTGVTDSGLYKQCEYINSGSGDAYFSFKVPNGNYTVKLYTAIGGGSTPFSRGSWIEGIDSQGSIYSGSSATTMTGNGPWTFFGLTGKQIDACDITGSCASRLPGTVTLTDAVSDGNLTFVIRHLAPVSVSQPASLLNAFEITPISGNTPSTATNKTIKGNGRLKGRGTIK